MATPGRLPSYDDMPGGTEIQLRADGFTFSPYRILIANPMLSVPVLIRAHDTCHWDPATDQLHDTIELRLFAVPLGRMTMRLRAESPHSKS